MEVISKPEKPALEKRLPVTVSVPVWLANAVDEIGTNEAFQPSRSAKWGTIIQSWLAQNEPDIYRAFAPANAPAPETLAAAQ